jgi:hypothetical protein
VPQGRKLRLEFLAKLYFARREGPEVALGLIEQQREACRSWRLAQEEKAGGALRESRPYDWLVYEFRIGQVEAMLAWLDRCEEALSIVVT